MNKLSPILPYLVCPVTRQPLSLAPEDLVAKINTQITNKSLCDANKILVEEPIDSALIRADRQMLYPIRDGIPTLLPGSGLPL